MSGGNYPLPEDKQDWIVSIEIKGIFDEEMPNVIPGNSPRIIERSLNFKPRQPININLHSLPQTDTLKLRAVRGGVQVAPATFIIDLNYTAL